MPLIRQYSWLAAVTEGGYNVVKIHWRRNENGWLSKKYLEETHRKRRKACEISLL